MKIVKASAGSGKTYMLAMQYIAQAMKHPDAFKSILAVTFTNKATAEMKERILNQLHALANGANDAFAQTLIAETGYSELELCSRAQMTLSAILQDYSSFAISTIDKFFQRIVRSFFKELGLDINYELVIDTQNVVKQAATNIVENSSKDENLARRVWNIVEIKLEKNSRADIRTHLERMLGDALRSGINKVSERSLEQVQQLYHRVEEITVRTEKEIHRLCIEACEIMGRSGLTLDDFKGRSNSFVKYFNEESKNGKLQTTFYKSLRTAADAQDYCDVLSPRFNKSELKVEILSLLRIASKVVELYDATAIDRNTFKEMGVNYHYYLVLSDLLKEYNEILSRQGQIALGSTSTMLKEITQSAGVPFIFEKLGSKYSTIFIDEFQDTSKGQWEGFEPIIDEIMAQIADNQVMIIGDVKQAIYRWRGGDWRLLASEVASRYDNQEIALSTSWRSEEKIVEFNNRTIGRVVQAAVRYVDGFVGDDGVERKSVILDQAYRSFEQAVAPHRVGTSGGCIEMCREDVEGTVRWTVDKIKELKGRYTPSSIAVLVRQRGDADELVNALIDQGISFVNEEVLSVNGSAVVHFIINIMRCSLNGDDCVAHRAVTEYLNRDLTEEQSGVIAQLCKLSALEALERIIGVFEIGDKELYHLQTLYNLAYIHTRDKPGSISTLVAAWDADLKNKPVVMPQSSDAIQLLTIHKSKGLEFDAVLVPFATWGLLPRTGNTIWFRANRYPELGVYPLSYKKGLRHTEFSLDYTDQSIASVVDNLNLLYVAMTRAKKEMYIGIGEKPKSDTIAALLSEALSEEGDLCGEIDRGGEVVLASEIEQSSVLRIDKIQSYSEPALRVDDIDNIGNI